MRYKKFYMQKLPQGDVSYPLKETSKDWGMWCSESPFFHGGEAKELPQNDWGDEDGVEEYYPDGGIPLKSYDTELTFYAKGKGGELQEKLRQFAEYLTGKDGTGCELRVWDEYTGSGSGRCRFVKMSDTPDYTTTEDEVVVTVKVTLRVTDPGERWKPSLGD